MVPTESRNSGVPNPAGDLPTTSEPVDHPLGDLGVYGLRIDAPSGYVDATLLVTAPESWPTWHIRWEQLADGPLAADAIVESWSGDHAVLRAQPSGFITVDRVASRTTLHLDEPPTPATLLHPYLASTAVVAGHWLGRAPFHAGAFAAGGRAWGILGNREMGKSSLLMSLHRAGVTVLADDVLVVDGDTVYSGPRCLDLRRSAAERFDGGTYLGVVGTRERWRVTLPPAPPQVPFGGWILLAWTEEVEIGSVDASTKLRALVTNCGLTAPGVPTPGLLDLLAYPMVRLGRPQSWDRADEALEQLLEAIGGLSVG